ncbi:hypothetical protein N7536_007002 [Penicillium majusculum]|nr:hypothetical protein N7536_007002 [Penicillium majusculum]
MLEYEDSSIKTHIKTHILMRKEQDTLGGFSSNRTTLLEKLGIPPVLVNRALDTINWEAPSEKCLVNPIV